MAGTTLTSLAGRLAANEALVAATHEIFQLSGVAHRYTEAENAKGASIVVPLFNVPTAKDFNPPSVNYTSTDGNVEGVPINIDKHLFQGFKFSDVDFTQCPVSFWKGAGEAIGRSIGRGIASHVLSLINKTNIPKSATNEKVLAAATKSAIAALTTATEEADFDPSKATLLLNGKLFSELCAVMDANVYGGPEAIRAGSLAPGCYGFGRICRCNGLSTDSGEKLTGAILSDDALGYACSPLEPQGKASLDEYGFATDQASGLTIGFRRFADVPNGVNYMVGEVLLGAKLIQPTKVIRLVSAATA